MKRIGFSSAVVFAIDVVLYLLFAAKMPSLFFSLLILACYALIPVLMYLSSSKNQVHLNLLSTLLAVLPAFLWGVEFIRIRPVPMLEFSLFGVLVGLASSLILSAILSIQSIVRRNTYKGKH